MNDQTRILRLARAVWRASSPTEASVAAGAERVAQRLLAPKSAWNRWYSWTSAGAAAALLGAVVHGSQMKPFEVGPSSVVTSVAPPKPPIADPSPAGGTPEGDLAPPHAMSPSVEAPRPSEITPASPEARIPVAEPRSTADPTWMDVSAALAAADHARAERLLLALSDRRHDANTRAKANLGLAQLDEARGDCASAGQHALRSSAIPGVEIKTVRRALELAARCHR